MATRIQLVLQIDQGDLGGMRELASTYAVYIERKSDVNYTYLLKCADGSFYCGWTNHLKERVEAHNKGIGAKYTKGRRPVILAYYEEFATKQEAMRRECALKKLTHGQKEELSNHSPKELPLIDGQ